MTAIEQQSLQQQSLVSGHQLMGLQAPMRNEGRDGATAVRQIDFATADQVVDESRGGRIGAGRDQLLAI